MTDDEERAAITAAMRRLPAAALIMLRSVPKVIPEHTDDPHEQGDLITATRG